MMCKYVPQNNFFKGYNLHSSKQLFLKKYMKLKKNCWDTSHFCLKQMKTKQNKTKSVTYCYHGQFIRDDVDISDCLYMLAKEKNENILTL